MSEIDPRAAKVTKFWRDAGQKAWFNEDPDFDAGFHDRFRDLHFAAARRELEAWLDHPESALALMILLDQFPRNCFRGTGHMYATDPLARHYACKALAAGHDAMLEKEIRFFFYLPFSHSEILADHEIAVECAKALGEEMLKHAVGHRDIVQRFGRFPHRNRVLARETTPEEQAFLDAGGFSG
jgi:uncharacterized protein (DUF924 family)